MKSLALIFALGLSLPLTFATPQHKAFAADTRGMEQARILTQKLQLNESLFIQIKMLEDRKFTELDKALIPTTDENRKEAVRQEIENRYNIQIMELLNTSQKVAFMHLMNQPINPAAK